MIEDSCLCGAKFHISLGRDIAMPSLTETQCYGKWLNRHSKCSIEKKIKIPYKEHQRPNWRRR